MTATKPTLVFTTGWDWFQLVVNLGTGHRVSHVAIGLGDYLLHVTRGGVVLEPRAEWLSFRGQKVISEVEIVPDVSQGLADCFARVGQQYDHKGIFRATVWIALQRMMPPLAALRPDTPADAYTCSSFVMLLDPNGSRIPEWRDLQRGVVTPGNLAERVGNSFREVQPSYDLW